MYIIRLTTMRESFKKVNIFENSVMQVSWRHAFLCIKVCSTSGLQRGSCASGSAQDNPSGCSKEILFVQLIDSIESFKIVFI